MMGCRIPFGPPSRAQPEASWEAKRACCSDVGAGLGHQVLLVLLTPYDGAFVHNGSKRGQAAQPLLTYFLVLFLLLEADR